MVSGRTQEKLKRLIKSNSIVRSRPRGGKISVSIPQIDIPHFVHGDTGEGVLRGPGKEGDIIGRDPQPGDAGTGAGDQEAEGILVQVDMEEVFNFMEENLKLPRMLPKPNETFEEVKIKYNSISKVGLNSLRHTRRTMKEALKRLSITKQLNQLHNVPGASVPMKLISPIRSDFRFRQYRELKIPASNAIIFFARDCSGSMDTYRCEIVSDMAWWIDCWIKRFYKKVEQCYLVHDVKAKEVTEQEFYTYRMGGGTRCSSAFETIAQQIENRYPPQKYNIYVFYFTDGDNWSSDNSQIVNLINEKMGPQVVNLVGITQVCPLGYSNGVKEYIDKELESGNIKGDTVRTALIGEDTDTNSGSSSGWGTPSLTEEERNRKIMDAIRIMLGGTKV